MPPGPTPDEALQLAGWIALGSAATTLRLRGRGDRRTAGTAARLSGRIMARRGFSAVLTAEVERAALCGRTVAVALLDVDDLRGTNQQLGVDRVDTMLDHVGRRLELALRRIDQIATFSGGCFAVVMPDLDDEDIVAERIDALRALGPSEGLPLSAGYALLDAADLQTPGDLLLAADQALIAAKLQGGGLVRGWDHDVRSEVLALGGKRRERDAQMATVLALAEALDFRDVSTSLHSKTVGYYAELMATGLGFSLERTERVRIAGLLHDIGKIGIPDSVLNKPAKLTDDEWAQMRRHPEIGARLLDAVGIDDIRSWILAHHERPDGKGYPRGLVGDEVPIEARILAIADAYEAMTADRVYRKAPGPEIARAELRTWSGQQFDPAVVDVFLKALAAMEQTAVEQPVHLHAVPDPEPETSSASHDADELTEAA